MGALDILGYAAIGVSVAGFLSQNKRNMLWLGLVSTLMFGVALLAYNGVNGLFVTLVSIVTKLISLYAQPALVSITRRLSLPVALAFFGFFNPEGWLGILPATSLIFIMTADTQESLLKMKAWYLGSASCWLAYGLILGSIPAVLFDVLGLASLLYAIHRLLRDHRDGKLAN